MSAWHIRSISKNKKYPRISQSTKPDLPNRSAALRHKILSKFTPKLLANANGQCGYIAVVVRSDTAMRLYFGNIETSSDFDIVTYLYNAS